MGAKHEKTRKQKILADYRRNLYALKANDSLIPSSSLTTAVNIDFQSYSHVLKDVLKTCLLTISIIAFEIVLYFLFKNQVIKLPNISY